jgi:putative MATE family efflux protein
MLVPDVAVAGASPVAKPTPGRFLTGSTMRHILIMTGTSAIGLMCVFLGELASVFFLGRLQDVEILAAIGYAISIIFFPNAVGIGLSIATTAAVAPAVGAGDLPRAKRLATHSVLFAGILGLVLLALLWPTLGPLLSFMGAKGRTHALALHYLQIALPVMPLTAMGMALMAVLRSLGDARRSMNVPVISSLFQLTIEPLLIFTLGLGMTGGAIGLVLGRVAMVAVGLWGAIGVHRMYTRTTRAQFAADVPALSRVAIPAVATNLATPFANLFSTAMIARFGDDAVAAWAIAGRIAPVAFGVVFSLSGAVGPIIGQNYGARAYERVRAGYLDGLKANLALCAVATVALIGLEPFIIRAFSVTAKTEELVRFYCFYVAPQFHFVGLMFVANAAFNVLGRAQVATALNWARATLGTIPLVWIGGHFAGAEGAFFASSAGGFVFGPIAAWVAYRFLPGPDSDRPDPDRPDPDTPDPDTPDPDRAERA